MKKTLLILAVTAVTAFACLCAVDINTGFQKSSTHISSIIDKATSEIESNLIPNINKNTNDILEQNRELEKLLLAYQTELLQKKEILFLLDKHNKLLK
ncbi:hypothetical protein KDE13_09115 [Campylobacter sp. faydin G-140]|uniref:hypothetical protein n=1 Tax=Campylobacter anatolicus TaxID=2829105 RepID=UPI001BA28518|nr:hypothetical protein [Campylobacter anatolicus]MBR8466493.1 hypothetical protein [Campylobacter anatolicus]